MDGEALIRRTAVNHLPAANPQRHVRLIAPLLYDPVKAVRTEAAARLAGPPSRLLSEDQRRVFEQTLKEYIASMKYSGDFAFGRNLGTLRRPGQPQQAMDSLSGHQNRRPVLPGQGEPGDALQPDGPERRS
jgi:hypothetical protein